MPYCSKCGTLVPDSAGFCQNCGQPQPASPAPAAAVRSGPAENTAALLSYVLGWLTGLIFFVIDKRPYVRFHAAQSMITFFSLMILRMVLGMIFGIGGWFGGPRHLGHVGLGWPLMKLIWLLTFVLWIVLMVKAYQGKKFKLPITGDLAENLAGR
jgi:uncharacterized membrane protein